MERRAKLLGLDAPMEVNIRELLEEEAHSAGLRDAEAASAVREAMRIATGASRE
jgi:hypothetical protein